MKIKYAYLFSNTKHYSIREVSQADKIDSDITERTSSDPTFTVYD